MEDTKTINTETQVTEKDNNVDPMTTNSDLETDVGTKTSLKRTNGNTRCEDCKIKMVRREEENDLVKPYEGFDDKFTEDEELISKSFETLNTINNTPLETFIKTNQWTTQIVNFITDKITIWFDKDEKIVMRVRKPDNSIYIYNSSEFYKITAIFYSTKKSKAHDKYVSYYFEPAALSSAKIIGRDGCIINRFISISEETPQKFPSTIPEKSTDNFIFVVKNGFVAYKMVIPKEGTIPENTAFIKFNNTLYQIEKKNSV